MNLPLFLGGLAVFVLAPLTVAVYLLSAIAAEFRKPRIPILNYHRFLYGPAVREGRVLDPERVWAVEDDEFRSQCTALVSAGYRTIIFDELVAARSGGPALPDKPVVLTFDDGYTSNFELARPIMNELGMRGVFYVTLDPDDHSRQGVAGKDDWMTAEQLRVLASEGHSVQSHSVTHGLMSEMTDDQIRWELNESRARLEQITGKPVQHFCIPRAGGDRRVVRLIGQAGYLTSTGADKGTAGPKQNLLRLPRIGVPRGTSGARLLRRLQPAQAAKERVLADVRLVPTRVLGPRIGYHIRQLLYGTPWLRRLLQDNLGWLIATAAMVYAGLAVAWVVRMVGR